MRQVCSLDIHKDTIFACIMDTSGAIFQEKFGVFPKLHPRWLDC